MPSTVLRRVGITVALLGLASASVIFPARHVLLPPWPDRVEEWLIEARPGEVERQFVTAGDSPASPPRLLARSRPLTLWRIERSDGEVEHVWLAGIRNDQGELLPGLPPWLDRPRIDGPLPEAVDLIVVDSARSRVDLQGQAVERMYRPNDLNFRERLRLWRDRLAERWAWPFTATTDARSSPPRQSTGAPARP